jgi:hypothetical protein
VFAQGADALGNGESGILHAYSSFMEAAMRLTKGCSK